MGVLDKFESGEAKVLRCQRSVDFQVVGDSDSERGKGAGNLHVLSCAKLAASASANHVVHIDGVAIDTSRKEHPKPDRGKEEDLEIIFNVGSLQTIK